MKTRLVSIYSNDRPISLSTKSALEKKLHASGFHTVDQLVDGVELLMCIGGDGTTLEAIHRNDFPQVPIIGINTGSLGFFQEIHPNQLDEFIFNYKAGKYRLQPTTAVQAVVTKDGREYVHKGFNEVVVRRVDSCSAHFNISIGDSFIERYSGDGILVATATGSTAYNYSLGGSIVDPRLKLLQVTPIAPINTTAYRSFTSSILLPPDISLNVVPEYDKSKSTSIINDGIETRYEEVDKIRMEFSDTVVNLLRFETYDFWNKVKTKFL